MCREVPRPLGVRALRAQYHLIWPRPHPGRETNPEPHLLLLRALEPTVSKLGRIQSTQAAPEPVRPPHWAGRQQQSCPSVLGRGTPPHQTPAWAAAAPPADPGSRPHLPKARQQLMRPQTQTEPAVRSSLPPVKTRRGHCLLKCTECKKLVVSGPPKGTNE